MKKIAFLIVFIAFLVGFQAKEGFSCSLPANAPGGGFYDYCVDYYGGPDSIQSITVTNIESGTITASGGTAPAYLLSEPYTAGLFDISPESLGIQQGWSGIDQVSFRRAAEPPVGSWPVGSSHCVGEWTIGTGYFKTLLPTCGGNLYLLHNARSNYNELFVGN
jgi:hypothetical protein